MTKTITRITIILCSLFLLHTPKAYCQQDTTKARHTNADDDNEDDAPQAAKKKKVHNAPPAAFGIEAGVSGNFLLSNEQPGAVFGFRGGVFAYIPVAGVFCIQPGLYYVTEGGKNTRDDYSASGWYGTVTETSTTLHLRSLEVPVMLGFRWQRRHGWRTFIGIGPYVAQILGASSAESATLNIGTKPTDDIRPFDYGIGIRCATELRCGFFTGFGAQCGLANLNANPDNSSLYPSSLYPFDANIQIGWAFGGKAKHHKHIPHKDDEYIDRRM